MRNTFFFLATVIGLYACQKSSNNPAGTIHKFDSISRGYLTGFTNIFTGIGPYSPETFYYKYAGDRFSLRMGGFTQFAYSGGYYSVFTPLRYDTVIYDAGSIMVVAESTGNGILYKQVDTVYYRVSNNMPQTKIYYDRMALAYDTTLYYYSPDQKLTRSIEDFNGTVYEKTYAYSPAGNVETIEGKITARSSGNVLYTSRETFGDYDNTPNPLKAYWLWDESFERSLSQNNFRAYSYRKWDATGLIAYSGVQDSLDMTWHFQYTNGLIDYSK